MNLLFFSFCLAIWKYTYDFCFYELHRFVFARRAMVGPVGGGAYPPVIPRVLWIHCSDLSVVALSEIGPVGGPAFVRAGGGRL